MDTQSDDGVVSQNAGPRSQDGVKMAQGNETSTKRVVVYWKSLMMCFIYPFWGIGFFASKRFLHPLLTARILPCLFLSIAVLVTLFMWTYLPQVALLAILHRFGKTGDHSGSDSSAWFNGTILVLGEATTIISILFEVFLADSTLVNIFDAVLVYRGCEHLVARLRTVDGLKIVETPEISNSSNEATGSYYSSSSQDENGRNRVNNPSNLISCGHVLIESCSTNYPSLSVPDGGSGPQPVLSNPLSRLDLSDQSSIYSPFSCVQITEFALLLPLNLIPYVGVPLFLFFTGRRAGPLHHWRYFKMRGFRGSTARSEHIKQHRDQYTAFGFVTVAFQLVPVLSMIFLLTSAAGSALWAAALEHERLENRRTSQLRAAESGIVEENEALISLPKSAP